MGCHTWFLVPTEHTKEDIINIAKEYIEDPLNFLSESEKELAYYAIEKELVDPVAEMARDQLSRVMRTFGWRLYICVEDHSLKEINKKYGTNYGSYHSVPKEIENEIERYTDEPRIGGYPNDYVKSYDEMVRALEKGLNGTVYDEESKKYVIRNVQFRRDEEREKIYMPKIKQFFERHPEGIIVFG